LRSIADRLVDLLPVIRNHVYHPDFGGSFGLKSVLPALVPELSYDDLAINEGMVAGMELERLLFTGDGPRDNLLRYCERDTFGLVKVLSRLRELVRGGLSLKVDSTVSIELDNAAEGAHGHRDVGSCSSL